MKKIFNYIGLLFISTSILLAILSGCSADTKENLQGSPQSFVYPETFPLKPLNTEVSDLTDIQLLGGFDDLSGMLCYFSIQNQNSRQSSLRYLTPLMRQLHFKKGKTTKIQTLELPKYNALDFDSIGWPIFMGRNKCLYRALERNSDVGRCQLYFADLTLNHAKMVVEELFLYNRLLPSPNGNNYAYETAEPWDESYYRLLNVRHDGIKRIISKEKITATFSWTPHNTLIYPDYPPNLDPNIPYVKNHGYPNIYEDDLHGNIKKIIDGAYRPSMSPNEKYLAIFNAFDRGNENSEDVKFSNTVNKVALKIYDLSEKKTTFITRIYEEYPDLFWSKDGMHLYVLENFYINKKKTAFCRISVFDVRTKRYKVLCQLEQQGESSSYGDKKLRPRFIPIKMANNTALLFQVLVNSFAKNNYHVIAVDLNSGKRNELLTLTSPVNMYNVPTVDWIDAGN